MDEREGREVHEQGSNRGCVNSLCTHAEAEAAAAAAAGYLSGAGRPPTLEIFPSWPMRHQQQLHSVKAPISHDH